ncbi:MAG: glycogen debranching protein GlgX [Treponema sp.]|jgi:glycogen operon protein|nr:glycogen debranching protein GlgX [Treponema sp.]
MNRVKSYRGKPYPLGAALYQGGVNFSVFSHNAVAITLEFYAGAQDDTPAVSYQLDPQFNKTGDIWHIYIPEITVGALYVFRADGPFAPEKGYRFNKKARLLDPYAKALTNTSIFANLANGKFPKCVVIDNRFDWQGDQPLNYPLKDCVIYETHVKGLTAGPASGVRYSGTYRGILEKIPYFKQLGITSLELLPIHEFDEFESYRLNPQTGEPLKNYWGYSTLGFFAPKASYGSDQSPGICVQEFKEMVRGLHRNGIEVILDVVFNHTAEGNERGPSISFRGFENSVYYHLEDKQKQCYKNYSGCGNTVNCNHPVTRQFIMDCLRYWVIEMHVDGFRFDLAPILARGRSGEVLANPPLTEEIAEDPALAKTKIIAEAWDAGGAYLVGAFPGARWAEWNDRFRDDIRRFWHGESFFANSAATRLAGSADLYLKSGKKPFNSINFIACHDGFTLNDVVSYNTKHNDANGEENRDGSGNNCSYNYGFEGPVVNPAIEQVRLRQIKNMFLTLMLSQGTPMILGGDEFRRTQDGNNNAYCQDTELSWYDWTLKEKNAELFRFCKLAINFRRQHPAFRRPEFFEGLDHSGDSVPDIAWYNRSAKPPDWQRLDKFLAFYINGDKTEMLSEQNDPDFYIMCNADTKDTSAVLPPLASGKRWARCVDTSIPSPDDFLESGNEEALGTPRVYVLPARSMAVLMAK